MRKFIFCAEIVLTILGIFYLCTQVKAYVVDSYLQRVTIHQQEVVDLREIKWIELTSSKGTVLLSGDKDLPLIKFLLEHNNQQYLLKLEIPELTR